MKAYVSFSGEKVPNTMENRVLDAGRYGSIAIAYVNGTHPFESHADMAGDWARLAAHHALIAQAMKDTRRNKARRDRDQAYRDCGLVKVRGALGGIYWE